MCSLQISDAKFLTDENLERLVKHVRATYSIPETVDINISKKFDLSDISPLYEGSIQFIFQEQSKRQTMWIDQGKTLYIIGEQHFLSIDPDKKRESYVKLTKKTPFIGKRKAQIRIVEFTDLQCPLCRKLNDEVDWKQLIKEYDDQIVVFFKNYPLVKMHDWAYEAATASLCAYKQGKIEGYFEMKDKIFEKQAEINVSNIQDTVFSFAGEIYLKESKFRKCYSKGNFKKQILSSVKEAVRCGIKGTPTLLINGKIVYYRGLEDLKHNIDTIIESLTADIFDENE